jgi:hypothetical protein
MNPITDILRKEYEALQTLRHKTEWGTHSFPIEPLQEETAALAHLMRANEENADRQTDLARMHLVRAGRDFYLMSLLPKLDKLRALSAYVPPDRLSDFRQEYEKIRLLAETARAEPRRIHSLNQYLDSLSEIDRLLDRFSDLEIKVATERRLLLTKRRRFLDGILAALIGAVLSALVAYLMK